MNAAGLLKNSLRRGRGLAAVVVASLTAGSVCGQDALRVAKVFGDHMVLQRGEAITVWGTAPPGRTVAVQLGEEAGSAEAADDGSWHVVLDPQDASAPPRDLTVRCETEVKTLHDVVIGDVWFCAGQSNMAFELSRSASFQTEESSRPNIRLLDHRIRLSMGNRPFPSVELESLRSDTIYSPARWSVSTPETAAKFSAVAWYFGATLEHELEIPIGLIHCAVGGSPMEAWTPRQVMADDLQLQPLLQDWLQNPAYPFWVQNRARVHLSKWLDRPIGDQPHHPFEPGILFEGAIQPTAMSSVRGVLWYQGESNATVGGSHGRPVDLAINEHKIRTIVTGFRGAFRSPELPFLMVQLPGVNREWPVFREAQARVAAADPNVHMAVTIDLGHSTDVHPRKKRPVGERLAHLALANVHDHNTVGEREASGPEFLGIEANPSGALVVRFKFANGLTTIDELPPQGFAVAGPDGQFWPATAELLSNKVRVAANEVQEPVAVRYAWENDPKTNLINSAGLPAAPFRSDTWPLRPKIRVACIGDSITCGTGIANRSLQSYPAQLATLLGPDFHVRNFGRAGAGVVTRSMRGDEKRAYLFSPEHKSALTWTPDVVISNLGINDLMDWEQFGENDFAVDYRKLIQCYRELSTKPEFLLWTPLAPLLQGHRYHDNPRVAAINRDIGKFATQENLTTVGLAAVLQGHAEYFSDHIHPNAHGAKLVAVTIAKELRKKDLGRD